jgi:ArsR family transcriptional regulator
MSQIEYSNIRKGVINMVKIMKALSHQNRLRILSLINQQELCVCELQYIMQVNQSNVSRHLSKLKQAAIIKGKRQAQWIFYQINGKLLTEHPFLELIIEEEVNELEICKEDNKRLSEYQASDLTCRDLP